MKMRLIVLLVLLVEVVYSRLLIHELNITLQTGAITTRGNGHVLFSDVTGPLVMEIQGLDPSAYYGAIVFRAVRDYFDEEALQFEHYGALAMISVSSMPTDAGNSIVHMRNDIQYNIPTADMTYIDYGILAELYTNLTLMQNITLYATLDSSEGNVWKDMIYSGGVFVFQIYNGLVIIFYIAWYVKILWSIIKHSLFYLKATIIISSIMIFAGLLRLAGLPDFNGWLQLTNYHWSIFITSAGVCLHFICAFLLTSMMSESVKKHTSIKTPLSSNIWPYLIPSAIFAISDWMNSVLVVSFTSDPAATITITVLWFAVIMGIMGAFAIIFLVVASKVLRVLARSVELQTVSAGKTQRKKTFRRNVKVYMTIGGVIISYTVLLGVTFTTYTKPIPLLITSIVYTTLLNILAYCIAYLMDRGVKTQLKNKSTKSGSGTNGSSDNQIQMEST